MVRLVERDDRVLDRFDDDTPGAERDVRLQRRGRRGLLPRLTDRRHSCEWWGGVPSNHVLGAVHYPRVDSACFRTYDSYRRGYSGRCTVCRPKTATKATTLPRNYQRRSPSIARPSISLPTRSGTSGIGFRPDLVRHSGQSRMPSWFDSESCSPFRRGGILRTGEVVAPASPSSNPGFC